MPLPTYQLEAITLKRAEFNKLPFRDDLGHNEHKTDQMYRTRAGYPTDVFMWVPIEDETQGEWHRAPVNFT